MTKTYLSAILALSVATATTAQTLVSTSPQPRKLVIEEFTGIYCVYCPDGAAKVQEILDKYPDQAMAVGIHSSNQYSQPQQSGHPDFRTQYGSSLQTLSGLSGFPAGMVNRIQFAGWEQTGSSLAMNRNYWMSAADQIIDAGEMSPVNIGLRTTWNASTRELTIETELYFTANEPAQDRLHIHVTESNIIGHQTGGSANYNHKHVLRDVVTGFSGELISTTTQGTLWSKTYTVDIPSGWDIDNMEVIAFVTDVYKKETRTGENVQALNGSTAVSELKPEDITMSVYPNPTQGESKLQFTLAKTSDVNVEVLNLIGETVLQPFSGTVQANRPQVVDLGNADLKAGIYFVRIQVGQTTKTIKLHVLA